MRVAGESRVAAFARPAAPRSSSVMPRLSTVSIIPGIEIAAPERTDTSSGRGPPPKRRPVASSSHAMPATEFAVQIRAAARRSARYVRAGARRDDEGRRHRADRARACARATTPCRRSARLSGSVEPSIGPVSRASLTSVRVRPMMRSRSSCSSNHAVW